MSTPHIEAKKGEIAKIVLMPGDPLRAKFFAQEYLTDFKQVNNVRGMLAFTGKLDNKTVTVMGHGMGLDSIGIYSFELYKFYDVDTIIRFGSCGSYRKDLNLFDVFVAENSFSESNYGLAFGWDKPEIKATQKMIDISKKVAKEVGYKVNFGTVNSSMWFYQTHNIKDIAEFVEMGIDVVEMESYALYSIANALHKNALTILTISDNIATGEVTTPEERRIGFTKMFDYLCKIVKEI